MSRLLIIPEIKWSVSYIFSLGLKTKIHSGKIAREAQGHKVPKTRSCIEAQTKSPQYNEIDQTCIKQH